MWYFSWILGLGLALAFGILNAMWLEVLESHPALDSAPRESEAEDVL
jgi:cyd operon protein YbgT